MRRLFLFLALILVASCGKDYSKSVRLKSFKLVGNEIGVKVGNGNQQNPSVVYLPDKRLYFVVWEDWRNPLDADIYGQFLSENGSLCGTEIPVAVVAGSNQTKPKVAYSQKRQKLVVVYQDTRPNYIYFKVIDLTALNTTTCTGANVPPTDVGINFVSPYPGALLNARFSPYLSYNPSTDTFYISWVEVINSFKRINQSVFTNVPGRTCSFYVGDPTYPVYTTLTWNNLTNTYQPSGTFNYIREAVLSSSQDYNQAVNPARLVETYNYSYFDTVTSVKIKCSPTSSNCLVIVAGQENSANLLAECIDANANRICDATETVICKPSPHKNPDLSVQKIYAVYDTAGGRVSYTLSSGNYSTNPDLTLDPSSGRYMVVWESDVKGQREVVGRILQETGVPYTKTFLISDNTVNGSKTSPVVEYDSVNQRFFVVWVDSRNGRVSLENLDLYGQFVDSQGSLRGKNLFVVNLPGNQLSPSLSYSPNSREFLVVWKDGRALNSPRGSDIYAQRYSVGQPILQVLDENGNLLRPSLIDFGVVKVKQKVQRSIILRNVGDVALNLDCLTPLSAPFFYLSLPVELQSCGDGKVITLNPQTDLFISMFFQSNGSGVFSQNITIKSDGGNITLTLQGQARAGKLTITDTTGNPITTLNFGNVEVGTNSSKVIELRNDSLVPVEVFGINPPKAPFTLQNTFSGIINPGQKQRITVTFSPDNVQNYTSSIGIVVDYSSTPITITLNGTGTPKPNQAPPPTTNTSNNVSAPTPPPTTTTNQSTGGGGGGCSYSRANLDLLFLLIILFFLNVKVRKKFKPL